MLGLVEKFQGMITLWINSFVAKYFARNIDSIAGCLNNVTDSYYTYHKRPKYADHFRMETVGESVNELAVVIQGALGNSSFVLETTNIYKHIFPGAHLLVSTWVGESVSIIAKLQASGIEVILNEKPINRGISNINMQIVSSRAGVECAKRLGAIYVLKTRADQRIYATNVHAYFRNLLSIFPPQSTSVKERIIGISLNSFRYRMYGLSDMLVYGHIDDMSKYWNVKLDSRDANTAIDINKATLREYAEWNICEVYLTTEYLKSIGHLLGWTLEDSWNAFRRYFCIVDKESIDLFWNKYVSAEYRWLRYDSSWNPFSEIMFRDWLQLYKNENWALPEENVLDRRIL